MIKELKNIDEDIKEIDDNILKVREKYIYLLCYHNSFLKRVFEKYKGIDKINYDKCFIDIKKEIL